MAAKGTYYLGRVLKLGVLDHDLLIEAIRKPATVTFRGNAWTFTDVQESQNIAGGYIFGRLSKYAPEGEVGVVDEATRSEQKRIEPNLLVASSPFIYVPEHSGIAFLNVSGKIEPRIFIRRFSEIVEATHQRFFVDCDIDLISDLKSFAAKLSALDGIFKIEARISPPNPLFGPLWKSLEEYLRNRNTDRMAVVEDAPESDSLNTKLPELVTEASKQTENVAYVPSFNVDIGDAAILMAADGYGSGKVRGRKEGEVIVIKTSETAINFSFSKIPDPNELYIFVKDILERIKDRRHLEHGE